MPITSLSACFGIILMLSMMGVVAVSSVATIASLYGEILVLFTFVGAKLKGANGI